MFVDSHVHFDMILEKKEVTEAGLLQSLKDHRISYAVQISIDRESMEWSCSFAKRHRDGNIFFTLGIHPSSRAEYEDLSEFDRILDEAFSSDMKAHLFGIGECGLDFYRMRQGKDMQIRSFEHQIEAAKKSGLPLIVHSREAMQETVRILKNHAPLRGIMHCFPGDTRDARTVLDLGLYISFAGNVTYQKAHVLHESASYVPLDRMLIETDSPFLTPVPYRGKKNRPEYITHTYDFISRLRGEPVAKIADAVLENFVGIAKRS